MQKVFVLDNQKQPLMLCHPSRARQLLSEGRAAIFRRYPFTIILKNRKGGDVQPLELKIDPGSKTSGIALVAAGKSSRKAVFATNLQHRGHLVKESLISRLSIRRSRRGRKTRYRPARFNNRRRENGWIAPSLKSRVDNVLTWSKRLKKLSPITSCASELVRFDMQLLQNPEISGIEYQQGSLQGYEIREYLLEKFGRSCVYCGKQGIPLEIDHIVPKSLGGSDRVSNLYCGALIFFVFGCVKAPGLKARKRVRIGLILTLLRDFNRGSFHASQKRKKSTLRSIALACQFCNQRKGNLTIQAFVKEGHKLEKILFGLKKPLQDAAAVNSTRYKIAENLKVLDLPVSLWSGGRTKHNRLKQNYPKEHWIDAVCVGETGIDVEIHSSLSPLLIKAQGLGHRQMCRMDAYGFPRTSAKSFKQVDGFKTGDIVKARVTQGKKRGFYQGRVAIRTSGSFNITSHGKIVQGIHKKFCKVVHRSDGYTYAFVPKPNDKEQHFLPRLKSQVSVLSVL